MDRRSLRRSGALATVVALAALWVVSGFVDSVPFPPTAIADFVIRATPGGFATFFIELLQHWALRFLAIGVVLATVLVGGQTLVWTARGGRPRPLLAGAVLAVISIATSIESTGSNIFSIIVAAAGAGAVYAVAAASIYAGLTEEAAPADPSRRRVIGLGVGSALGIAALGGAIGWLGRRLSGPDRSVALVEPSKPATIPDRPAFPAVPGQTPEVTAAEDHYVVDINLVSPTVEAEGWTLEVTGEVDTPLELTFGTLQSRFEVVEDYSVLTCISNEVGGPLVGHSAWAGVRLRDVLESAGVHEDAVDVVFRAADGYTDSITLDTAMRDEVLLAVAQNGEPLLQEHGFPCRVRVPPIYGMKNVKWLRSIEVVGSDYKGYWMRRGWSDVAIVKTQSRIDVVGDDMSATAGQPAWIAGVAWAGDRGVAKVEVSVDGGATWTEAELKEPISGRSWRLWALKWTPEGRGDVDVTCRATDGDGEVQAQAPTPPHPDGASGWHSVGVEVS